MNIVDQLHYAKLVDNYEIYTGVADIYWESTQSFKAIVPAAKRWFVIGGVVKRDNSSTLDVSAYNAANKMIAKLDYQSAAASTTGYPNYTKMFMGQYLVLDAGMYVRMIFGTAQSTAAEANVLVLEVDV